MKIDTAEWKEFVIGDYFNVSGTKTTKIEDLIEYGNGIYPYVTTQATNNGVAGFYNFSTESGNVLTIDSAVVGFCSYQELPFSASDHVEKLTPKFALNRYIGLFLAAIINREQYKYSYGRKCNQNQIRETVVKLPAAADDLPNWDYMERYIKSLHYKPISTKIEKKESLPLRDINKWDEFRVGKLFDHVRGKRITKENRINGNIPLVTAGFQNQGIAGYIETDICELYSDKITIDMFGNTFYRKYSFYCDDNILALTPKHNINVYAKLFIVTALNADKYRYSYGRQYRQKDIKKHVIKLPVTAQGEPDWDYMEHYIKSLPYSDKIQ
jgi:hypothetical protein